MNIKTVVDSKRGCGWRKPGGLYLRSEGLMSACGRLPLDLERCPCCGGGVKPTRSWTWVNPVLLLKGRKCEGGSEGRCLLCPLGANRMPTKAGLLWIGGSYYEKPEDWIAEAAKQGVSRRITAVPKGFKAGETLVLAAHRKHHQAADGTWVPAVFHAFTPTALEYVVKGDETDEKLEALVKRGVTPVKVVRDGEFPELAKAEKGGAK
jgi:hypothetical protein